MDSGAEASGAGEDPSTSSGVAEPTHAVEEQRSSPPPPPQSQQQQQQQQQPQQLSRYESQKRRDWNTFLQYLRNHKPPLTLARCSGAHVIEFLKYLDQFGKTKVHASECAYFGHPNPPEPCACPLRQAWGSLDALIGRLRAAYEESGGKPESNPFGARAVGIYLREVRESQAKARGIPYEKKKRKRFPTAPSASSSATSASSSSAANTEYSSGGGEASAAAAATSATAGTTAAAPGAAAGEGSSGQPGGASASASAS